MNRISACMIVKDEEKRIEECLENIKDIVDEIIIVDGYSTDRTVEICRRYTNKVFKHKFSGSFSVERNYSISKARYDWILVIDADEALSPKLKGKIRELLQSGADGYCIPRVKICKNKRALRHGRAYPDYQLRLFRKTKGKFIKPVHERVKLRGKIEKIGYGFDLLHFDPTDFRKNLRKVAKMHSRTSTIPSHMKEIISVFWGFFFKKGFLDGWEGFKYHLFKILYSIAASYFIIMNKIEKN